MKIVSRREVFITGAGILVALKLTGCGPVVKGIEVVKQVPWDKVITVVVNLVHGIAILIGIMDDKEIQAEVKLTDEQLEKIKKGESVVVEVKYGRKETIKPKLEGK